MPVERPNSQDIYTVSRLNREVRNVLEDVFPTIWLQGEISNLARPASGHLYFSLKDSSAQIRCAMFRNRQSGLRFKPDNGMQVLLKANLSLYEARGEYQLIVESMEPAGEGTLQLAFESLKKKLSAERMFDEAHKKVLPIFPSRIGIITSSTGAAIRDIINVLGRRYPAGGLIVYPVPVQGNAAAARIAKAIQVADHRQECQVLIVARGGGSLEDLWAFNEEVVARAIHACAIPIVSGVGHETDFSIADFVADQRAPTPSAAAEMVSPDSNKLVQQLKRYEDQLIRWQSNNLQQLQRHVDYLSKQIPHPEQRLCQIAQSLDANAYRLGSLLEQRLAQSKFALSSCQSRLSRYNPQQRITNQQQRLVSLRQQLKQTLRFQLDKLSRKQIMLKQQLQTLSPNATLARGYAIVTQKNNGKIVRQTQELRPGDQLNVKLAKGHVDSKVTQLHEN